MSARDPDEPTRPETNDEAQPRRAPDPTAKVNIKAVAQRAGVAISTVSRVVNGGSASKLARQRVQEAIAALGYAPSVAAQSLVNRRAGCIGLAVNSTQSPWFSRILLGVEEALAPSRKSVLVASVMITGEYDPSAVMGWIQERRVDGLILVRYSKRDEPLLEAAAAVGMPTVLIAPDILADVECIVRCNNAEAGRLAGKHLVDLGHRRIAFAGGPRDSMDTRERLRGLSEVLESRGLTPPVDVWHGTNYGLECGEQYAARYLERAGPERASAVVLGNDPMALGFMRSVLAAGLRVPHDVSVVGFDGAPDGAHFWPSLTTVSQPTTVMAARACRALLDAIEGPSGDRAGALEFAVELIARESTAAPRP